MQKFFVALLLQISIVLTASAAATTKQPVPSDDSQKAAIAVVKETYKAQFDGAKTPEQKVELAKEMLKVGISTTDDLVGRYALYRIAKDIAIHVGDLPTALKAIERTGESFEIDELALKIEAAKSAFASRQPKDHESILQSLLPLVDSALEADRYDLAESSLSVAVQVARAGRINDRLKQLTAKSDEVKEQAKAFADLSEQRTTLNEKSTDPAANLAVGKFYCFNKGNWQKGIPMIALGDDEELKALALAEFDAKADGLKLGDTWWERSEKMDGSNRLNTQKHASEWYRKALPSLSGLTKARVEAKLQPPTAQTAQPEPNSPTKPDSPTTKSKTITAYVWDVTASAGQQFKARLKPDGTFGGGTWARSGSTVTVKWKAGWVDRLTVSEDGKSMTGTNQNGNKSTWKLINVEMSDD